MARNAGEALGVFSRVNLDANSPDLFDSTVNVNSLYELETLLAGESFFKGGLSAPKWPQDILGTIDNTKAAQGQKLYQQNCQACHMPPVSSEAFKSNDRFWTTIGSKTNRKYLKVNTSKLATIGTDPKQAENWSKRMVNLGALAEEPGLVNADTALKLAVDKTVANRYDALNFSPAQRDKYNGYRPDKIRRDLIYTSRPLNGIWATAPFLHNGSVPNLYELLLPAEQRSSKFYLGTREFDPKTVGFKTGKIPGGFLLDTSITGNSNAGHEFKGDGSGPGVIGPELSDDDRWALLEYLKTL